MPYIYKIVNNINGKVYIGKTKNTVEKRFSEHCKACELQDPVTLRSHLYSAMKKYGKENFHVETITECSFEEQNNFEKYYIKQYNSCDPEIGYNIAQGGDGGILWRDGNHPSLGKGLKGELNGFYGKHHSKETIEKIRNSNKGRIPTHKGKFKFQRENKFCFATKDEAVELIKDGWIPSDSYIYSTYTIPHYSTSTKETVPYRHSKETKEKIGAAHREKTISKEQKDKAKHTRDNWSVEKQQEVKNRMSLSHKGKKLTEAQKRKIGDSRRGKPVSDEARKNMSIAQKKAAEARKLQPDYVPTNFNPKGSRWITNGVVSKMVFEDAFEEYLNKGWVFGRKIKNTLD